MEHRTRLSEGRYDESIEIPDAEDVLSTRSNTPEGRDRLAPNPKYDEAIDVHDPEDIATPRVPSSLSHSTQPSVRGGRYPRDKDEMLDEEDDSTTDQDTPRDLMSDRRPGAQRPAALSGGGGAGKGGGNPNAKFSSQPPGGGPGPARGKSQQSSSSKAEADSSGEDDDDDDDDEDADSHKPLEGAYNPADYEHLTVSQDIKELFQYIQRYTPQNIELDTYLRPFIPEYIPSVGDIDAFLKVPRPDQKPDALGLLVLDEPCANQSDPTVLDLHLRAISKQSTSKQLAVKTVESGAKQTKAIDQWIKSIGDLHRSKPPPTVHYKENMPDIESLMQAWPPDFEELLKSVSLPTAEINCDLSTYVTIICTILGIPVHKNKVQSLHVLFTLFSELRDSQLLSSNFVRKALLTAVTDPLLLKFSKHSIQTLPSVSRNLLKKMEKRAPPKWIKPEKQPGVALPNLCLYNSLTQEKEEFIPMNGKRVLWYGCGPTVYDASHMGHARCYISTDIIRRVLMHYFHFDVHHVMNITDIDDKIIKRARQNHLYDTYCAQAQSASQVRTDIEAALSRTQGKLSKETDKDKREMHQREAEKITQLLQAHRDSATVEAKDTLLREARDALSDLLDSRLGNTVTENAIFVALPEYWEMRFHEDMRALNILPADELTRVREFIPQIIRYVEKIVANGFAYESNGSVYFNTSKFASDEGHYYAKLVPTAYGDTTALAEGEGEVFLSASAAPSGSVAVSEKRNATDFALWKASKAGEPAWDSPWGRGRPGWHIECSVMASETLGERMDIHSGGVDLKFPHHDNELAQSEAYYQHGQWVNYFLHSGHLTISGCKMSKSLKNFITIGEALQQYSARRLRLAFLLHSWKDTLDYGIDTMLEATNYDKLLADFFFQANHYCRITGNKETHSAGDTEVKASGELDACLEAVKKRVEKALCDSIDTREALNAVRDLITAFHTFAKAHPNPLTISSSAQGTLTRVAQFVTWLMRVFGCDSLEKVPTSEELPPPFGLDLPRWDEATSPQKLQHLREVFTQFQDRVALAKKEAGSSAPGDAVETLVSLLEPLQLTETSGATLETSRFQPWLDVIAARREAFRALALHKDLKGSPLSKALLAHCDWLRNEAFPELGVRLEDKEAGPPAVALVDKKILLEEKLARIKMESEKKLEKERLAAEKAQKEAEKAAQARIPPGEMFRTQTELYSKFDDLGVPTHNAQGEEISKGQRKKLQKAYDVQKKLHDQYLAANK